MNVTKTERKESTKHCCGSGCRRRDSAEHEEEGGALIGQRITENNVTNADRVLYGELRETQTANYFSTRCRIDCAVPPANAPFCRKHGTLLLTGRMP